MEKIEKIKDKDLNDKNKYFKEALKNKRIIKEMFEINSEAYKKKIEENNLHYLEILDEINLLKGKSDVDIKKIKEIESKASDDYQKHLINLKLLLKTKEQYNTLIKEKEKEISSLKQKNIFIDQDIKNKEVQINSVDAQIIEAEYQNKILKEKSNSLFEKLNKNKYEEQKINSNNIDKISIIGEDHLLDSSVINNKVNTGKSNNNMYKFNKQISEKENNNVNMKMEIDVGNGKCNEKNQKENIIKNNIVIMDRIDINNSNFNSKFNNNNNNNDNCNYFSENSIKSNSFYSEHQNQNELKKNLLFDVKSKEHYKYLDSNYENSNFDNNEISQIEEIKLKKSKCIIF